MQRIVSNLSQGLLGKPTRMAYFLNSGLWLCVCVCTEYYTIIVKRIRMTRTFGSCWMDIFLKAFCWDLHLSQY